jgi:hypothetical protein
VTFESLGCYSLIILSFYLFLSFGWRGNDGNLLGALSDSKWFSDYYYLKKKKNRFLKGRFNEVKVNSLSIRC